MDYYVYLISDSTNKIIHAGYCTDIEKVLDFYNSLESLSIEIIRKQKYRLVYIEKVKKEGTAIDRVHYFTFMPLDKKIKEILSANPNWQDLSYAEGQFVEPTNRQLH